MHDAETANFTSLVFATDADVLAPDKLIERRDGYWRIESPGNPDFWWGNFLIFDDAPARGDGEGWPEIFASEFAHVPEVRHQTFAWDRSDGDSGSAATEFPAPYVLERTAGLVADAGTVVPHPRENREAKVVALDPEPGKDEHLWREVIEIQVAQMLADGDTAEIPETEIRTFRLARARDLREIFRAGRGAWYVALLAGEVVGSLGIVVTAGRARYQTVDTVAAYRGRGIASLLVAQAAQMAAAQQPISHYVIAADPDYHAISIYESLGFERKELVCGVVRRPQ